MAKSNSRGGGVVIRRTNGRTTPGNNTAMGRNATSKAVGSPTSSTGKHLLPKKEHVVPRNTAS
jgi:hypothetical protein